MKYDEEQEKVPLKEDITEDIGHIAKKEEIATEPVASEEEKNIDEIAEKEGAIKLDKLVNEITIEKVMDKISIKSDDVIDCMLTGTPIKYRFKIGKIEIELSIPQNSEVETLSDNLLIQKMDEYNDNKEQSFRNTMMNINRMEGDIKRDILFGLYLTRCGNMVLSPLSDGMINTKAVWDRSVKLNKTIMPALKDIIITYIVALLRKISEIVDQEALKNF